MLRTLLVALLVCVALASDARLQQHASLRAARADPHNKFAEWVREHRKPYADKLEEYASRFKTWLDNLEYVIEYNSKTTSHWLGMNSLADLTQEEYRRHYLGYNPSLRDECTEEAGCNSNKLTGFRYENVDDNTLPRAIDWRKLKAVTPVKNQLQCGSCWAFSTTGSVEGVNAIVTKELVSLSEQELVDCDTDKDKGCNGGLMDYAFEFIIKNGGLDTEADYKYEGSPDECVTAKRNKKVVTIDGYEDVPANNEMALKKAVAAQPVSVAIEADQRAFQLYSGGVFDAACGTSLDHGVLAVGYGFTNSTDGSDDDQNAVRYWIVKNSWGEEWGDEGYISMKMGVGSSGICGIAMVPSYPVKTHPNPPKPGPDPPPGPTPGPGPSPGPDPAPVDCDAGHQCPVGNTCCCLKSLLGFCWSWGCCPMENAVCCDDHSHCCPSDLPVCDTFAGRCLPQMGVIEGSVPWSLKTPAQTRGSAPRARKVVT